MQPSTCAVTGCHGLSMAPYRKFDMHALMPRVLMHVPGCAVNGSDALLAWAWALAHLPAACKPGLLAGSLGGSY